MTHLQPPAKYEQPPDNTIRWEYLLTTTVLSFCSAFLISGIAALKPERYSQLIVGDITWAAKAKHPDYLFLFSLVFVFLVLFVGFNKLAQTIRKVNGESAELGFRSVLVYALLPFAIVLGKVFVKLDESITEFLVISLILCCFTIAFAVRLAVKRVQGIAPQDYVEVIGGSLLYVGATLLTGSTVLFALGQINLDWQTTRASTVRWVTGVTAILLWIPLIRVWASRSLSIAQLRKQVRFLLWAIQTTFPLLFLALLPVPAFLDKAKFYSFSFTLALPILIAVCAIATYVDWFRRTRSRMGLERSIFSAISPIGLLGLLLYLKAPLQALDAIVQDDYHFGEFLLPWWSLENFNQIPFWDYEPARGLVNYLVGPLANLFYSHTAVGYQAVIGTVAGSPLWIFPFLCISFAALSRTIGLMPAFVGCLLMTINNGLSEIDSIMVSALCLLGSAFFAKSWTKWLLLWGVTGLSLFLFAPAQAGLLLFSTFPITAFVLFQAIRKERPQLLKLCAIALPIFLLTCGLTPLGKMLFGAVRYLREQSSINSVAHGIAWSLSRNANPLLSYSIWETIRFAWIPIGIFAALLLLRAFLDKTWAERDRVMVFGIPILLLTVLLIPRAVGRIDPTVFSRPGAASTMAVCLLLPILLITAYGQRQKARSLFLVALFGGVLIGIPTMTPLLDRPTHLVNVAGLKARDASQLRLSNLSQTLMDPLQYERLAKIKPVLNAVIDPGETYLDLTNRNAQYFYLGYRPPIQSGAFYNLAHRDQQARAVQQLETDSVPIVLASAETILPDQIPASLRSYLIYRFVVQRYVPVKINQFIYLVQADRISRLINQLPLIDGKPPTVSQLEAQRFDLFEECFQANDLRWIPTAWGASFDSLQPSLKFVRNITQIASSKDIQPAGDDTRITGTAPSVVYDVGDSRLNGNSAGILVFDFLARKRNKSTQMEVSWASQSTGELSKKTVIRFSARNGKVVVPLDAAPRWLLAEGIRSIQLNFVDLPPGSKYAVSNIALFQRSEIEQHQAR